MNKCIFMGRLTHDPEARTTSSGKNVVDFSVAVNEGKDRVTYVNCVAWDFWADFVNKYFAEGKGKPLVVETRYEDQTWDDKTTGDKRHAAKFVVKEINFVPSNPGKNSGSEEVATEETAAPTRATRVSRKNNTGDKTAVATQTFPAEEDEDDVPF